MASVPGFFTTDPANVVSLFFSSLNNRRLPVGLIARGDRRQNFES
jgi:hypothetical protein